MGRTNLEDLSRLIVLAEAKLTRLKKLVNWLHTSEHSYGCESELSYDPDGIIEQAELILGRAQKIATRASSDPNEWRNVNIQILTIRRFSPQLSDCYDELEYLHLLRREAIEGNPLLEQSEPINNPCEPLWFDELACANGVRHRDDTN